MRQIPRVQAPTLVFHFTAYFDLFFRRVAGGLYILGAWTTVAMTEVVQLMRKERHAAVLA